MFMYFVHTIDSKEEKFANTFVYKIDEVGSLSQAYKSHRWHLT